MNWWRKKPAPVAGPNAQREVITADEFVAQCRREEMQRAKARCIETACIELSCEAAKHGLRLRSFKVSHEQMEALHDVHGRPGSHQCMVIAGVTGPIRVVERNA